MIEYSRTIEIDAGPERVWDVMRQVERWREWTASITAVELLEAGELGPGARVRVRQPRLPPNVFTITRWEPGRGFAWTSRSPGMTAEADHRIEARPGGCAVTLSVRFEGLIGSLVGRLYGGLTRDYIELEAQGLKRRAEGGSP